MHECWRSERLTTTVLERNGGGIDISNIREGEIRNNNKGTPMKIICYRSWDDIDVEFLDKYKYVKEHATYSNLKKGEIKKSI